MPEYQLGSTSYLHRKQSGQPVSWLWRKCKHARHSSEICIWHFSYMTKSIVFPLCQFPPRSFPPSDSPNFIFMFFLSLFRNRHKQKTRSTWANRHFKSAKRKFKTNERQKKKPCLNKATWNKEFTKIPLSLLCVDQFLLGKGPALRCG